MITAKGCRMNSLALTCEYCEKYIEPQLITKTGPIYHGMYDLSGTKKCYISKTYAGITEIYVLPFASPFLNETAPSTVANIV